jgi:putative ABC transport system permease protein
MPGVLRAEPYRAASVRIGHGHVSRRVALVGTPPDAALSRVFGTDEAPIAMPGEGVVLSETLAGLLGVRPGETVEIEVQGGDRRLLRAPVSGISLGYFGLGAAAELSALNRMLGEGAMISGARIDLDPLAEAAFFDEVKATPQAGFLTMRDLSLTRFRETMAENINVMITVFVTLAAIIAMGVVYNFARISLSEQGRELASLRVLGFTKGEVAAILNTEIAAVVLLAQPVGWLIGTGIAILVSQSFTSELYRAPVVIGREVYAIASLVVIGAAAVSALLVRGRINRLDMIEVLKTRE